MIVKAAVRSIPRSFLVGLTVLAALPGCGPKTYVQNSPDLTSQLELREFESPSMERYPYPFTMLVEVEVDETGTLREAKACGPESSELYTGDEYWGALYYISAIREAAVAAVRNAHFVPARVGDRAVRQRRIVPVRFNDEAVPIQPPRMKQPGRGARPPDDVPLDMLNGHVVFELLIGPTGRVLEANVLEGTKILRGVSRERMLASLFEPARQGDDAVAARICYIVENRIVFVR